MQRLIIILFLIIGIPIISNAAGIYDNSLINFDKNNKEKLEKIEPDKMHFLLDNPNKIMSVYEVELRSILKKNATSQNTQDKPLNYQQYGLSGTVDSGFVQAVSNEDMDVQVLLETEMDWTEIKTNLEDANAFLDKFDRWATNLLDEYLSENINTNMSLVTNIQTISSQSSGNGQLKGKIKFHEKNRLSNVIYQRNTQMKGQHSYKAALGYNSELHETYEGDDNKENILSIVYLWNMYSDTIILVSIIATLWLSITSLIKFLTRHS